MERNQALQSYTGWLHTVARGMTAGHIHDDLVQEGYIAMWRAYGSYDPDKGSLDYWLKNHAINRMRSVVAGERMTSTQERKDTTGFTQARGDETRKRIAEYEAANPGASGVAVAKALGISQATLSYQRKKMGTVTTAAALTDETVSMEAMTDAGWDLEGSENLESVFVAYHAGEIWDALSVLTPAQRKYVVARFWHGNTQAELTAMFGYDPSSLWRVAKPKLQLRLAYLSDLVSI